MKQIRNLDVWWILNPGCLCAIIITPKYLYAANSNNLFLIRMKILDFMKINFKNKR